jgi:hypothetical protein
MMRTSWHSFSREEPDVGRVEKTTDRIEFRGWLQKQGEHFGNWRNRWFVLTERKMLRYYKTDKGIPYFIFHKRSLTTLLRFLPKIFRKFLPKI